ncbi:hypothetical protein K7432_016729 [Basidiobolus ranarum]|uniref:Uncharacterized protein n=1 Tax=Basidiobolus ranarum TaxID=34480 RepID=A0ABR2VLB7_9FUNG
MILQLLCLLSLSSSSNTLFAFPTIGSIDTAINTTNTNPTIFAKDWQENNLQSVPYVTISFSIILPIIAIAAGGYLMWKKWRQIKETKRRVKLAIQNYLSSERNETIVEPPVYTRRSSQPVLLAPIVKKIDDAAYRRISSTMERPAAALIASEQVPPEYSVSSTSLPPNPTVNQ